MPATAPATPPLSPDRSVAWVLAPIMAAVFIGFLIIGMAMPVLPLHVHQTLGLGNFAVGLVAGSQFAASLLTRMAAGRFADSRGGKRAVVLGLAGAAVAGGLYLLSLRFVDAPQLSVGVLLLGRALLGAAESFIITGAVGWGLHLAGPAHTGKVIAWVGSAMYGAFAIGAPIGTALHAAWGFAAIALATGLMPLLTLLVVLPLRALVPQVQAKPSFLRVLGAVWVPGMGLAFSSIGLGAITAFVALLFSARGWDGGWQAFTAFAVAFIAARTFGGHLPDRFGGARVALASALVEAGGLAMIWLATVPAVALAGAALAGLGYSLVYPGLGVEAVRRAPPESRALAMGAYTACLDLALGVAGPALGLMADRTGLPTVFLVSAVLVLCSAGVAACVLDPKT